MDAPLDKKLLCCNSEDVAEMKEHYNELRQKIAALQHHIGRTLTVLWTSEDKNLSRSDWEGEIRICEVTTYRASQEVFVLRFSCGYEKIVGGIELIQVVEDSEALTTSKKVTTKKSVFLANTEWKQYQDAMVQVSHKRTRIPDIPALTTTGNASLTCDGTLVLRRVTDFPALPQRLQHELDPCVALRVTLGLREDMTSILPLDYTRQIPKYIYGGWLGVKVPWYVLKQMLQYLHAALRISPNLKELMLQNSDHLLLLKRHFEGLKDTPFWTWKIEQSLLMMHR